MALGGLIAFIIIIGIIVGIVYLNWWIWDFQSKKIESGCVVATQNYMGQPTRYQNCEAEWWETLLAFSQPSNR
jgi:hypothetical protein